MTSLIGFGKEVYIVRHPLDGELKAFEKLSTAAQYNALLGLIINKKIKANDFTGNLKELNLLVNQIKEVIKK